MHYKSRPGTNDRGKNTAFTRMIEAEDRGKKLGGFYLGEESIIAIGYGFSVKLTSINT